MAVVSLKEIMLVSSFNHNYIELHIVRKSVTQVK